MSVSFNSVTLPLAKTQVGGLARRDKIIEFPGNDGVEVLGMGIGAREIVVRCTASAGTPSRATLEALMDADPTTLSVDGDSFGSCRCIDVARDGKQYDASIGNYREFYVLTFRQETPD